MVTTNDKSLEALLRTLQAKFTIHDNSLDDGLLHHKYKTPTALYVTVQNKTNYIALGLNLRY